MLKWFDANEAREFGISLAGFYIKRIPPGDLGKDKSLAKRQEVIRKMFEQVARFKANHKLNIYKRAQLGNAFKWALKDAGYEPSFVDEFTKELMILS